MNNIFRKSLAQAINDFVLILFIVLFCASAAGAALFTVSNNADSGAGSLRQAIADANGNADASNTIVFDAGVTGTITLTSDQLPTITKALTITGPGQTVLAVDGGDSFRVFDVSAVASISDLTIQNGSTASAGAGIWNDDELTVERCTLSNNSAVNVGGGIYNLGALILENCTFLGNDADTGGGIYNATDTVTLTTCTFSDNNATSRGGGIYNDIGTVTLSNCTLTGGGFDDVVGGGICNNEGTVTMSGCTLAGNRGNSGGGVFNSFPTATLNMTRSTVSGNNVTSSGGGVWNNGSATLTNCTLSGNSAVDFGGGISNFETTLTLIHCTLSGNTTNGANGGGIFNDIGGSVVLTNSVLDSGQPDNCFIGPEGGTIIDNGGNLQNPGSTCGGTIPVSDPVLGPLQYNGGLTQTHALLLGSPAIDNIPVGDCPVSEDQRGVSRPQEGDGASPALCDSGAYEYVLTITASVPTLSGWGMIVLSLVILSSGIWFIRRRKSAA